MIKQIDFVHYRKLIDISIGFSTGLNAIAGTNGTCKSSLLYIIGNSFQAVPNNSSLVSDSKCLKYLKAVNSQLNPKIESMVKGDRKYTNPGADVKGTLFSITYINNAIFPFRRHNSHIDCRFALKPYYKKGNQESLPYCPVVYLGLPRLLPCGELPNEARTRTAKLPDEYQVELKRLFSKFVQYDLTFETPVTMAKLKKRIEFTTKTPGIDSNTISAGEDNLSVILTSLVSLKYYYDSLVDKTPSVVSVLLIDELDSTLHPTFQRKLLNLLEEYSSAYKIQVIFTTQSATLLRYVNQAKGNIIYLIDNVNKVSLLDHPEWYQIEAHLEEKTTEQILADKKIPFLLEDDEARWMLQAILDSWSDRNEGLAWVAKHIYLVGTRIGCGELRCLFKDKVLNTKLVGWACVLDGDNNGDISSCIISLPGKNSPERMLFLYARSLFENDDSFWEGQSLVEAGFSKVYYLDEVDAKIRSASSCADKDHATYEDIVKNVDRVSAKAIFNDHLDFFEYIFEFWMADSNNRGEMAKFFDDLKTLYKKVCVKSGLPSGKWSIETYSELIPE